MPEYRDIRGVPVTAANQEAVAALDATVAAYLGLRADTGERLKAALALDPDLVLGHVARGCFLLLFANRALVDRARAALEAARAAAGCGGANARERGHVAALEAWLAGDIGAAHAGWRDLLIEQPRDLLALKLAEFWGFYAGDAAAMRASIGRVLHGWDEAVPGWGFLAGMHAFALEEAGALADAERLGRRAVEINPADIWAAHAVAHVLDSTGRAAEGVAWIDGLAPGWAEVNNFAFHAWWHAALFRLEDGEVEQALALYDWRVRPGSTGDYLDIANAASLLVRLELAGADPAGRWAELAERAAERTGDHMLAFADAHYAMALGDPEPLLASARAHAAASGETQAAVLREVGLALLDGVAAFRAGDWAGAVASLLPVRERVVAIGGSHAQRDVFDQILIEASVRARRLALARALLSERRERRPWDRFAKARWPMVNPH